MPNKRQVELCPHCGKPVKEFAPEAGGTVTDTQERRWHYKCFMRAPKKEIVDKLDSTYGLGEFET